MYQNENRSNRLWKTFSIPTMTTTFPVEAASVNHCQANHMPSAQIIMAGTVAKMQLNGNQLASSQFVHQ
jgi:hypothetical protein